MRVRLYVAAPLLAGVGIFFGKLAATMAREGQEAFGKSIALVSFLFSLNSLENRERERERETIGPELADDIVFFVCLFVCLLLFRQLKR